MRRLIKTDLIRRKWLNDLVFLFSVQLELISSDTQALGTGVLHRTQILVTSDIGIYFAD